MEKVPFEDGIKEQEAYVTVDGINLSIIPAKYSGKVPLSAFNINKMQDNIENEINITKDNIKKDIETNIEHRYILKLTSEVSAGTEIIIPCNYKVGEKVLDVYYMGQKLLLSSDDVGTDGHYCEVGTAGSISNKIKTTSDWPIPATENDPRIFEFIVKGEWNQ